MQRASDRSVEWVLDLPAKIFVERDPVLSQHLASAQADAAYENLCLLYVAMTRAKRAMYIITQPVAAKSTSRNFPRLLQEVLGETWSEGDAQWFEKIPLLAAAGQGSAPERGDPEPAEIADNAPSDSTSASLSTATAGPSLSTPLLDEATTARVVRRPARTPSDQKASVVGGAPLFALEGGRARSIEFGLAVHAAFAEVEWLDAAKLKDFSEAWSKRGDAGAEALACLRAPELAHLWEKSRHTANGLTAEVWRERAFEVVLDGVWITGAFDRVIVVRDAGGCALRASVIDFKTDRMERGADLREAAERHAAQLKIYRRVVAMLTGLAPAAVTGEVIMTRVQRRVEIPL